MNEYITNKPSIRFVILIFLAILIPAIIFAFAMFFGINATGKKWNFKLVPSKSDSTYSVTVTAFQNIDQSKRGTGIIVVIIMCSLLLIQFFTTLYVYVKICYTSYSSTINVALKKDKQECNDIKAYETNASTEGLNKDENKNSNCSVDKVIFENLSLTEIRVSW